jgi:uncharacterized phage protein (TIGR02220 family)
MVGYIKLHRGLCEHSMWLNAKFTEGQAWVDLILLANHCDGYITVRGIDIDVKRGQVAWSQEALAKRWKWSRGKVIRFCKKLEAKMMLQTVQQKNNLTTLFTIVKYEDFQSNDTSNSTTNGQQTDNKRTLTINDKNDKNKIQYSRFIEKFNFITGKNHKEEPKSQRQFNARLKEGNTVEDILMAVENASKDKYLTENIKYLTPEYITRADKLEKWMNASESTKKQLVR